MNDRDYFKFKKLQKIFRKRQEITKFKDEINNLKDKINDLKDEINNLENDLLKTKRILQHSILKVNHNLESRRDFYSEYGISQYSKLQYYLYIYVNGEEYEIHLDELTNLNVDMNTESISITNDIIQYSIAVDLSIHGLHCGFNKKIYTFIINYKTGKYTMYISESKNMSNKDVGDYLTN